MVEVSQNNIRSNGTTSSVCTGITFYVRRVNLSDSSIGPNESQNRRLTLTDYPPSIGLGDK